MKRKIRQLTALLMALCMFLMLLSGCAGTVEEPSDSGIRQESESSDVLRETEQ